MARCLRPLVGLLALTPALALAQSSDAAYCDQLAALAYKYIGSSGGDGRSSPDLNTLGAISDCRKGNYAKGIPYLERRLRDSHITLPARS
jgi:hypothetical protein